MIFVMHKKFIRYYYWLIIEFFKKHLRLILISFFLSFLLIIGLISITPFINTLVLKEKKVIGLVGNFELKNPPEEIVSKISNGLVFVNEKGEIIPALATSWELLDQNKTYRLHIRRNLFWSNGKPFTANDMNYYFTDVIIKVADDYTINFKLKKSFKIFPTYLNKPIIAYPLDGIAGLYKAERIKTKFGMIKEVALTPNKKNIPFIVYKIFDSENKLMNAYKLGEINSMHVSRTNTGDFFKNWKNSVVEKSVDYAQVLTLFFNMQKGLLKENIDLREAITDAVLSSDFTKQGALAHSPIPPISWAYNPNLKKQIHDLDRDRKIINKYKESTKSAELNLLTNYDNLDQAKTIVQILENVGLKINLKLISYSRQNEFDLLLAYWKVPNDPDQYYFWHSTQPKGNITGYNKPKIDKLLEDGRNTYFVDERKKIYFKFQEVFMDDPPAVFLYYPYTYEIRRK